MTGAALSNNGTPDRYLDFNSDLWVEFKYIKHLPREFLRPADDLLSPLQRSWLNRRSRAGDNAWVIIGFPYEGKNYGVLLASHWEWASAFTKSDLLERRMTIAELADSITKKVS